MREMKDSGIEWIGEVPNDWRIVRNKNAFVCNKELVGEKSELTQLLSLTTRGIKKKDINNAEGKLPESFDTYQFVKENDIVMCLFDLDCSAVFSGISPFDGMISPAYRVLSCKESMEPRYADYWFRYISDGRKFNHYAKNIRYTLSYEEFSALPLLLPEKSEQRSIADYLDRKCSQIDAIIAWQQEVIEKLKAYKLSVITEEVTKGLNPDVPMKDSGVEWIGEIPEHWVLNKLKYLSLDIGDGIHATPTYDEDGNVYFVNGNNIGEEYLVFKEDTNTISDTEYASYKLPLLTGNTVFVTLNGATYGKISFYHGEKILLGKSAGFITLKSTESREFIRYYLQSYTAKLIMDLSLLGSTIANLSLRTLRDFVIPYPPIEEQIQIVNHLNNRTSSIDAAVSKKEKIVDELIDYKKSLIYEVVTGKKEV